MSAFISAMDATNHQMIGVNGSDVYTMPVGKQQELLALFGSLNRNLEQGKLIELIRSALGTSKMEDMAVLTYHTRDILEGKGERDLFYTMFHELYKNEPEKMLESMKFIPEYGAWFDLQKVVKKGIEQGYITSVKSRTSDSDSQMLKCFSNHPVVQRVVELYADQLTKDSEKEDNFSLAAKWIPREGKRNGWIGQLVAKKMYPDLYSNKYNLALKKLRQTISVINNKLETVETKMCHDKEGVHRFSEINPAHVPSRCLKIKRKAFFNETKHGEIRNPEDEDRQRCRKRFEEHIRKALEGDGKVNGRRLMPHEFIMALEDRETNETDQNTLQAQWNDLRDSILEKGSLGKTVVMCDFSGSMSGMPMNVSKGLGLLCAECTHPAFRNRMLTFDSTPNWHDVSKYDSLYEKIKSFRGVSQGLSTNFQAAVDLILRRLIDAKVPVGEEPDVLLVLTDMGWDQANNSYGTNGGFETHIDRIRKQFENKGGWKVPTIVVWNISGNFQEFHHEAETVGTCTISGWSPNILKYIMSGENLIEKLNNLTPLNMMREVLDDPRYDPIRQLFIQ